MGLAPLQARLDALELRLDAARRRPEVPGQLTLDLQAGSTTPSIKKGPGGGEQCGDGWIAPNKTCRKGQGQPGSTVPQPSEARRSRPKERISFEQPIVGPTGAKLTGYTWQWSLEEVPDKEGEIVEKRVSNWDESLTNVETGRNVVHQFEVQVGGDTRVVSAESALKLLGFTDAEDKKRFGSLKSTARTVARLRMGLQQLDQVEKSWQTDWEAVEATPRPQISSGEWEQRDGYRVRKWRMGDASVDQIHNSLGVWSEQEVVSNLVAEWKGRQMEQRGWDWTGRQERSMRSKLNRERDDLNKRLARAQKKLQAPQGSTARSDSPSSRLDALLARLDALKRRCTTGYSCGSACISPAKECRSEGGKASTGKERLRRLQELAQGAAPGRGIGQLRGEAAAAKAQQLQEARNQQAQQLRTSRAIAQQQARDNAAAAAAKGRKVLKPTPPQDEQEGPRPVPPPGGSASNPKQAFEAASIQLGRGMFGSVRLAQDGLVIKRGVLTQAEIRVLELMNDSPATPRLHAVQTTDGPTAFRKGKNGYMVMDVAKGEVLTDLIRDAARSPEELREAFSGMLQVRKTLHTAGVAHNDMHAGNLFWDRTSRHMTAIDFGMSRIDPTAALIEALGTGRGLMKFNKVEAPGDYQSRSTIQALNRGRAQTGNPDWKRFQANRRRVEALLKAEGASELITRSIRSVPKNNPLTKQRAAELIQMLYEGL